MSKLKLWKQFSLFMVLLLMSSLVAVVPAPVRANLSSVTVNPYDTSIIGAITGYRITMTTGATLNAGDTITIAFPGDTYVPDPLDAVGVFVGGNMGAAAVSGQQVTVGISGSTAPIVPGQQFTVTFNQSCNITNPATSGPRTVTVWTSKEPIHVTSSSYEITAVKVYTGATKHSENATIQGAIDAAISGDTITVPVGTFTENVNVNRSLTLQGASSATVTVTAANPAVSVFNVTASSVNISGFTVSGATGGGQAGIFLGAGVVNCNISNNILTGNYDGIWLGSGSNHNALTNNTLSSNYQGFEVYISNYNTFTNNIANSNTKYGFKIDSGDQNTFTNNTANSNGDKGFYSVEGDGGGATNSTFTNNTANFNTRHGLHLIGLNDHITLTGNTFAGNLQTGIKLQNVVTNLTLDSNSISGSPIGINISNENFPDIPDVSTWTVRYNNISGNTNYGVSNAGTGTLNAKHNYWGHASGPSHLSPVAYGDNVTANVTFRPWLIAAYTGTPPASEITISTTSPLPDGTTGVAYSTPLSAAGGVAPYTWSLYSGTLPPGLSFVGSNLSGTPTQVKTGGFNFEVQVKDGTQATSENFTMKVYGGGNVVTTTSPLPGGTINVPYGPVQLEAIGGKGPGYYTWSLNVGSGPLPAGLTLGASTGKITGTPTAADTFNFTVKVESDGYAPGTKDFSITISAPSVGGQKLIGHDDAAFSGYGASNYISITKYTASTTDNMTEFRIKCNGSGHVKVAVYSDNSSQPYTLLGAVNTSTAVVADWNTISFPSTSVIKDTSYWLACISDTNNICGWVTGSEPKRWKAWAFSSDFPNPAGSGYSSGTGGDLVAGWATAVVSPPTVINVPPEIIAQTSARLNGQVTATGGEDPTVIIYWGESNGGTDPYNWEHSANLGYQGGTFNKDITGLSADTNYYFSCFAANSGGTAWAASNSFTTLALGAPTVTNSTGASSVTATSARLNGAITNTGGEDPTVKIYWGDNDGTTSSYNWDNSVNLGVKGAVTFYTDITDELTSGTKYYYRCYGSSSGGTAWAGSSANFTTPSGGGGQKLIGHDDAAFSGYGASNYISVTKFTASEAGTVTEFRIKCAGNGHVKVAMYDDSGDLLNSVGSTSVVSDWNTISFPSTSVTKDTVYWLAYVSDTNNICGWVTGSEPKQYKAWAFSNDFPNPAGSGYSSGTGGDLVAGWSTAVSAPPAPPTIVTPTTTVTFGWNASSEATKYKLQVNTASDFTGTSMFDAEVSTTSQAVLLTIGTTYYWRVKAGNAGGWSGWSATGSITP